MGPRVGWRGLSVVITSGPTRERLDPVRFLTNASTGRMGFALAGAARTLGARVVVVSGPTHLPPPRGVRVVPVTTALEMYRRTLELSRKADLVIGAAAVGDWRFARRRDGKIKRSDRPLSVTLVPNPDILAALGRRRSRAGSSSPALVGFALETGRWLDRARGKLRRKRLDAVVANQPASLASGKTLFAVVTKEGDSVFFPRMTKERAAREILGLVRRYLPRGGSCLS